MRAPLRRIEPWRQISNLNGNSEAEAGAHEARLRRVGSCCMMLRILIAGALVGLPLLVSGALAQTRGDSARCDDLSRAAPIRRAPRLRRSLPAAASQSGQPAGVELRGLVSPFMPMPAAPPAAGADSTPGASPPAAAPPPAQAAAPPKPKKVAPPAAAARDRAQRRSSADASARHLLRHRQGVRALFGDRRRRRLADRHRRHRARDEGPGGGEIAQAPGDRRRPARWRGERSCLGQGGLRRR